MDDLISRQAAIDALWKALYEYEDKTEKQFIDSEELDVADWIQHRIFVQNMSDIDRQTILGLPSAQPEDKCSECDAWNKYKNYPREQQWIPCSEPPKESGTYIVTAYDGTDKRVTFVKYQKTLKRWDLTGARSYWHILAYKPLPEPWEGEEHGQNT